MLFSVLKGSLGRASVFNASRILARPGRSTVLTLSRLHPVSSRVFSGTATAFLPAVKKTPAAKKKAAPKKKVVAKKRKVAAKKKKVVPKKKPIARKKVVAKPKPVKYKSQDMKPPFKKPLSGFLQYFSQVYYPEHKSNGKSVVDQTRAGAEVWKTFSDAEKAKYTADPSEVKEYYEKRRAWLLQRPRPLIRAMNVRRRTKSAVAPRPNPPYMQFVKENFNSIENTVPTNQRVKLLAERWHELSDWEKREYADRAVEEFEQKRSASTT